MKTQRDLQIMNNWTRLDTVCMCLNLLLLVTAIGVIGCDVAMRIYNVIVRSL